MRAGAVSVRAQGGTRTKSGPPSCCTRRDVPFYGSGSLTLRPSFFASLSPPSLHNRIVMAAFVAHYLVHGRADVERTPLELAFENLLTNVGVHETITWALKINETTDRETFIGLDESEAGMKSNAAGFLCRNGQWWTGLQREMARVITAWQQSSTRWPELTASQSQCQHATGRRI